MHHCYTSNVDTVDKCVISVFTEIKSLKYILSDLDRVGPEIPQRLSNLEVCISRISVKITECFTEK